MKKTITCLTFILFSLVSIYAQTGYLDLKSQPSDADVYINNDFKGKTPNLIELSPGRYTLRIEYNGFEPFVKQIEIASDLVLKEFAELKGYVTLEVNTNPPGSIVYIDGKRLSSKTPLVGHLISTGKHKVKIITYQIPGYKSKGLSKTETINILSNHRIDIDFYKKLGSLYIRSNPSVSSFYLNNDLISTSSETLKYLTPGTYNIMVKAYLDEPYNEKLKIAGDYKIRANRKTNVIIDFYKNFKLGGLSLQTNLNTSFKLTRLDENNEMSKTIIADSTKPYEMESIIVGKYEIKWTDTQDNNLSFEIKDKKTTSLLIPVKKTLIPIKKVHNLDTYISKKKFISENYSPLPEYKTKSYIKWCKRKECRPNTFKKVYAITTSVAMVGGIIAFFAAGESNHDITGKIALAGIGLYGVNFLFRLENREKQVEIMENIVKNKEQHDRVLSEYDILLSQLNQQLEVENKIIIEENNSIEKYNKNLPVLEKKYISK